MLTVPTPLPVMTEITTVWFPPSSVIVVPLVTSTGVRLAVEVEGTLGIGTKRETELLSEAGALLDTAVDSEAFAGVMDTETASYKVEAEESLVTDAAGVSEGTVCLVSEMEGEDVSESVEDSRDSEVEAVDV